MVRFIWFWYTLFCALCIYIFCLCALLIQRITAASAGSSIIQFCSRCDCSSVASSIIQFCSRCDCSSYASRSQHESLLSASDASVKKKSIIVIGNPGVGKSMLLNRMAGEVLFEAGLGSGDGLTRKKQSKYSKKLDCNLIDTVGPNDASKARRKEAEEALREAFATGGPLQIVIIVHANHGRVQLFDRETIKMIHRALPRLQEADSYGVIVNQCPPDMTYKIEKDHKYRAAVQRNLFTDGVIYTKHLWFFDHRPELFGKSHEDVSSSIPELSPYEKLFMEEVPVIEFEKLTKEQADAFHLMTSEEYEEKLRNNKADLEKAKKRQAELEEECKAKHEEDFYQNVKKRLAADQRKARNTRIAIGFMFLSVLLSIPVFLTVFKKAGLDHWLLGYLTLWNGATVKLQVWLVPYLSVFILYKVYDVVRSLAQKPPDNIFNRDFTLLGNQFMVRETTVMMWHVVVLIQVVHLLSNLSSLFQVFLDGSGHKFWFWLFTTLVSCITVPLWLKGKCKYSQMLLYELFEEVPQCYFGLVEIPAGADVPLTVIASIMFSFLGVLGSLGVIQSSLGY